jgi:hypothetical protein
LAGAARASPAAPRLPKKALLFILTGESYASPRNGCSRRWNQPCPAACSASYSRRPGLKRARRAPRPLPLDWASLRDRSADRTGTPRRPLCGRVSIRRRGSCGWLGPAVCRRACARAWAGRTRNRRIPGSDRAAGRGRRMSGEAGQGGHEILATGGSRRAAGLHAPRPRDDRPHARNLVQDHGPAAGRLSGKSGEPGTTSLPNAGTPQAGPRDAGRIAVSGNGCRRPNEVPAAGRNARRFPRTAAGEGGRTACDRASEGPADTGEEDPRGPRDRRDPPFDSDTECRVRSEWNTTAASRIATTANRPTRLMLSFAVRPP